MIKINLLPPYVLEKQVVKRLMILFSLLLVCVVAAGLGWRVKRGADLNALNEELARTKMIEQQVIGLEQQRDSELAKIGPIQTKVKFIEDVMAYNGKAPEMYEELARFTYKKIRYGGIELSDQEMVITAYAPSISDAGRYLLNLYRATHIFTQISMEGIPQYSSKEASPGASPENAATTIRDLQSNAAGASQPKGFNFKVTCKLAQPLVAPTYAGAGGAAPDAMPGQPTGT